MKNLILFLTIVIPSFCFGQTHTVINHTPSANVSGNWRNYGFGQSFTIPSNYGYCCINQLKVHLLNFSINNGFSATFTIYSGNGMGGSIVYGPQAVWIVQGVNTFNFPSLNVTPGAQYTYEFTYPKAADGGIYAYVMNEHDDMNDTHTGGYSYRNGAMATSSNVTNYDDLFEIYYIVPLPIELLQIDAEFKQDKVTIDWTTHKEINNDYFEIERSKDGISWEIIEEVEGAGNSNAVLNYQVVDNNPYYGTSYYRLKQTDFDGKYSYSEILAVNHTSINDFIIYPNPFENEITLQFDDITDDRSYTVEVLDNLGRIVYNKETFPNSGQTTIRLDKDLPKGSYHVRVKNEYTVTSKKLLKL